MLHSSDPTIWSGRIDHFTNHSAFRYHQMVQQEELKQTEIPTAALIGFPSEEGVRRNGGRLGAAEAPAALRKELANLPWRLPETCQLVDRGDIDCSTSLEKAQQQLGKAVSDTLEKQAIPIIVGGGHETAFGHYLGIRQFIGPDKTLGIINIDAHFDLRSYEEQPSSGTMFKQILDADPNTNYLVLGIQEYGNTQALFDEAERLGVSYRTEEGLTHSPWEGTELMIRRFINSHDYIFLTLCMDVLNAAHAPGVSAPSPFGLDPKMVRKIIQTITSHEKTLSFDISEISPKLDEQHRTVRLGAYLVNEAIVGLLRRSVN